MYPTTKLQTCASLRKCRRGVHRTPHQNFQANKKKWTVVEQQKTIKKCKTRMRHKQFQKHQAKLQNPNVLRVKRF